MTKRDLADLVYNVHGGLSRKEAADLIDAFLNAIKNSLEKNERIQLSRFGVFEIQKKAERKGVNPKTKAIITIPAHKTIVFRPSVSLKDSINSH
jgi:nucleoid DNA-binding protein